MATLYSNLSTFSRFNLDESLSDIQVFVKEYKERVTIQLAREIEKSLTPFVSFNENKPPVKEDPWLKDNHDRFFKDTPNEFLTKESFLSAMGFITSMVYSPGGEFIVVGHSTGLIQLRDGRTGTVLTTLRNIQFPPKPVHALEFCKTDDKVCYAACTDGTVYRIEIPDTELPSKDTEYCIRSDPALEWLNTQYYGSPGTSTYATAFSSQRSPALSLSVSSDCQKIIVGYEDTSVKLFDLATQEPEIIYKVHKLRLQFIPKKLQRVHFGQVVAVRCHNENPHLFASAAWDQTLRIWDNRCKVGCMMTFEGVNVCHDAIDLNRNECISGSWSPTEALNVWDLTARKRLNVIRVQNRRPDVDGEYIYACRYWRSSHVYIPLLGTGLLSFEDASTRAQYGLADFTLSSTMVDLIGHAGFLTMFFFTFNRKGKYCIIGGSGTNCVEVINLHNRYISCSYPAAGSILAIASHDDLIAFGGTAPVFNVVRFRDPKHEKYAPETEPEYDYTEHAVTLFERITDLSDSNEPAEVGEEHDPIPAKSRLSTAVDISKDARKKSRVSTVLPRMSTTKQRP